MRSAGQSSFRQQMFAESSGPKRVKQDAPDLSLLQPKEPVRPDPKMRLDPGHFQRPAGGKASQGHQELGHGKELLPQDPTDPITHFAHEGPTFNVERRAGKRMGYEHGAANQTWTWKRGRSAQEALGTNQQSDEEKMKVKYSVGADGKRYYNMFGIEDLLPPATRSFNRADKPMPEYLVKYNNKESLPYCVREGEMDDKRAVHENDSSDRVWTVLKYQDSPTPDWRVFGKAKDKTHLKRLDEEAGVRQWRSLTPKPSGKKTSGFPMTEALDQEHHPYREPEEGDLELEWRVLPNCRCPKRDSMEKENEIIPAIIGGKIVQRSTPRTQSERRLSLSMTPVTVSQPSASPRSASVTPRVRDVSPGGRSPRSMSRSATPQMSSERFTPLQSWTSMSQGGAVSSRSGTSPRGASAQGDSVARDSTPRAVALDSTLRGNASPRGVSPRASTPRRSLSMTEQLITRRDASPRSQAHNSSCTGHVPAWNSQNVGLYNHGGTHTPPRARSISPRGSIGGGSTRGLQSATASDVAVGLRRGA